MDERILNPPDYANALGLETEQIEIFREIRDDIQDQVTRLLSKNE